MGDGAQVFDKLGAGHANAGVSDSERACGFIRGDADFKILLSLEDLVFGQLGQSHLF